MKLSLNLDDSLNVADDAILLSYPSLKDNALTLGDIISLNGPAGKIRLAVYKSPNKLDYISRKNFFALKAKERHIVTLGCDPEFVFVDLWDRVCRADSLLPRLGQIGHDGAGGELRPNYTLHEVSLAENLRTLIHKLPEKVERTLPPGIVRAEGHSEKGNTALGFHIHFGAPSILINNASPKATETLISFAKALDYFVGIPAMLLEDNPKRRLGGGEYGKPTDWRLSKHTFEYRSPGGFHLRHPDYTKGILALGMCAMKEMIAFVEEKSAMWAQLERCSDFSSFRKRFDLPRAEVIRNIYLSREKVSGIKSLESMFKSLIKFNSFKEHKKSIERFLTAILTDSKESPILLDNW